MVKQMKKCYLDTRMIRRVVFGLFGSLEPESSRPLLVAGCAGEVGIAVLEDLTTFSAPLLAPSVGVDLGCGDGGCCVEVSMEECRVRIRRGAFFSISSNGAAARSI